MTDLATALRDRFRTILDQKLANSPNPIPIAVPVGELADAACELVGAMPAPAKYNPDGEIPLIFSARTQQELSEGFQFSHLSVRAVDGNFELSLYDGETDTIHRVPLPRAEAAQFVGNAYAVVRHLDEEQIGASN